MRLGPSLLVWTTSWLGWSHAFAPRHHPPSFVLPHADACHRRRHCRATTAGPPVVLNALPDPNLSSTLTMIIDTHSLTSAMEQVQSMLFLSSPSSTWLADMTTFVTSTTTTTMDMATSAVDTTTTMSSGWTMIDVGASSSTAYGQPELLFHSALSLETFPDGSMVEHVDWLANAAGNAAADMMTSITTTSSTTTTTMDAASSMIDTTTTTTEGWSMMDPATTSSGISPVVTPELVDRVTVLPPPIDMLSEITPTDTLPSIITNIPTTTTSPDVVSSVVDTTAPVVPEVTSSFMDTTASSTSAASVPAPDVVVDSNTVSPIVTLPEEESTSTTLVEKSGWFSDAAAATADMMNAIITKSSDAASSAMDATADAAADAMDAARDAAANARDATADAASSAMDKATAAASSWRDTTAAASRAVTPGVVHRNAAAAAASDNSVGAIIVGNVWQAYLNFFKSALLAVHAAVDGPLRSMGMTQTWGIALAICTASLHALLLPLSIQQAKSSARMKVLKPYMTEIQERYYKYDQEKQDLAITQLMEDAKQNPLTGFLTTVAQVPIFFGLYLGVMLLAMEGQLHEPFLWIPSLDGPVLGPPGLDWFTQAWTRHPVTNALIPTLGWGAILPFLVMPVVLVVGQSIIMYVLQPPMNDDDNDTATTTTSRSAEEKDSMEKVQLLLRFMLVVIAFSSLQVPAGLTIYWFTSNIVTLLQSVAFRAYYAVNPPRIAVSDATAWTASSNNNNNIVVNGAELELQQRQATTTTSKTKIISSSSINGISWKGLLNGAQSHDTEEHQQELPTKSTVLQHAQKKPSHEGKSVKKSSSSSIVVTMSPKEMKELVGVTESKSKNGSSSPKTTTAPQEEPETSKKLLFFCD